MSKAIPPLHSKGEQPVERQLTNTVIPLFSSALRGSKFCSARIGLFEAVGCSRWGVLAAAVEEGWGASLPRVSP